MGMLPRSRRFDRRASIRHRCAAFVMFVKNFERQYESTSFAVYMPTGEKRLISFSPADEERLRNLLQHSLPDMTP